MRRELEKKKDAGPSSFTKSLLFEKDQQLDALKAEKEATKKTITDLED